MTVRRPWIALLIPTALSAQAIPNGRLVGTVRGVDVPVETAVAYLVPAGAPGIPLSQDTVVVDQLNLTFVPRLTVVQPGTTVDFVNSDPVLHNVFSPDTPRFNLGLYPRATSRPHRFTEPGAYVILCHIHPEMVAYVVVVPTAYQAVVDAEGHFTIGDIPSGEYALHVWQRRSAEVVRPLRIVAGQTTTVEVELRRASRADPPAGAAR